MCSKKLLNTDFNVYFFLTLYSHISLGYHTLLQRGHYVAFALGKKLSDVKYISTIDSGFFLKTIIYLLIQNFSFLIEIQYFKVSSALGNRGEKKTKQLFLS